MKEIVLYDVYVTFMGEKELFSDGHETLEEARELIKEEKKNHNGPPILFNIEKRTKTVEESGDKLIALVERNGWERETWRWWVTEEFYKNNKNTFDKIEQLFSRVGTVNQQIGSTKFYLDKTPRDKNGIDFEAGGYLLFNTLIGENETLDTDYISALAQSEQEDLFREFYKGGIRKLFKEGENNVLR